VPCDRGAADHAGQPQIHAVVRTGYREALRRPGQKAEQLRARPKLERRELVLPLRKLVAEYKVTTKGAKRATAYYLRNT
jgi:hypothetical protein